VRIFDCKNVATPPSRLFASVAVGNNPIARHAKVHQILMQMKSCRAALKEKCKVERGNLLARLLARLFALVNTESVEIGFEMSLMES